MKKKIIIGLISGVIIILIVLLVIGNINKSSGDVSDISIVDNKGSSDVNIDEIEIKDITKVYEAGVTTIRAKMYNRTDNVKNVTVKIILKDEQGNELKNMIQVVENLYPDREKVLSTGIAGDYSKVNEIKFEIIK